MIDAWKSSKFRYALIRARARIGRAFYELEKSDSIVVDLSGKVGMGAIICYALRIYAYGELSNRSVNILCSSPLYSKSGDVFARFFERPISIRKQASLSNSATQWLVQHAIPWSIPIGVAQDIFARQFTPNTFLQEFLGDTFDLSIHYRATDKVFESGAPPIAEMLAAVGSAINGEPLNVFLATDDQGFREKLMSLFPQCTFSSFELGNVRDGVARHFSNLPPADKAVEAIVNMFKLASANTCVRTLSYMSAIAPLINPSIKLITVNAAKKPFYFPEDVLWDRSASI